MPLPRKNGFFGITPGALLLILLAITLNSANVFAEVRPFLQAGTDVFFPITGEERRLDPGIGVRVSGGGKGDIFGAGISFFYADMELEAGQSNCFGCFGVTSGDEDADFFGGTFDFLISPLGDRPDVPLQPFITLGVGGHFLEVDTPLLEDVGGILFNVGLGLDYRVAEFLSIGVEGNYLPAIYFQDVPSVFPFYTLDAFDVQYFSANAHIRFHF